METFRPSTGESLRLIECLGFKLVTGRKMFGVGEWVSGGRNVVRTRGAAAAAAATADRIESRRRRAKGISVVECYWIAAAAAAWKAHDDGQPPHSYFYFTRWG